MTTTAPATSGELRRHNTARVLRALRDDGPSSRTALAARTGLAKATVGAIVGELTAVGAVLEGPTGTSARGRPSRPVALDGSRFASLGVEANVDYLTSVALDLSGREILSVARPPDATAPSVSSVAGMVREAADRLRRQGRTLLGVTVAVPGLVGRDGEVVTYAPNLRWNDAHIGGPLREVLGPDTPVRVENDANCAALAETMAGAAAGVDDLLYLTGTVGIGAGIVTGGSIMRGGLGYAGEVGHMRIGASRARCGCGRRGCWEAEVGLRAMLRAVGMSERAGDDPVATGERVAAAARTDRNVRDGLGTVAERLADGAAVLANTLSPELIVLGGYFVPLGAYLLPAARDALRTDVFAGAGCRAELSTLGIGAAAVGAASQGLADVFEARVALPG